MSSGSVCKVQIPNKLKLFVLYMKRISIDLKAVKAAVSLERLLGYYGFKSKMQPTRNGSSLVGPCPIHPGDSGNVFKVTLSRNRWVCHNHACRCRGNQLDFVAVMEKCDTHEAALKIDRWFSLGLAGKVTSKSVLQRI